MTAPALRATAVSKRFGPVLALNDIDFEMEPGEVHALLGVNGAGKSTFIKILSGVQRRDAGVIEIDGVPVDPRSPQDSLRAGIATVQQHPELVPNISGFENIFLGRESEGGGLLRRFDRASLAARAERLLEGFPVSIDLARPVGEMPAVEREIVAILQALAGERIRVLILDEPTSTLTEVEKAVLFRLMNALRDRGIAILYITHRLEEVMEIADRFSVFRGGRKVATMTPADVRARDLSLGELMLGESIGDIYPAKVAAPTEPVLSVQDLSAPGAFARVSLEARRGEILGVFGLVGSGIDELSKAIFGALPTEGGAMRLKGAPFAPRAPRNALRAGVFLLPGDRRTEGLTLSRSSIFNITIANLEGASRLGGLLRRGHNRRRAAELAGKVALQPPNLAQPVARFSGGNQQKVVIAKGLFTEADLYLFVEPTVGVDIGARARIYALMRELSREAAVIVLSSDCDEVFGTSDRVLALYKGRPVALPDTPTRDQLLMAGIMGDAHA
jgi:ABC-type sugar transport system ATPase subunit